MFIAIIKRDKPYEERLETLQLPSLAHRHHTGGDMILLYTRLLITISTQIFPPFTPLQGDISLNFSNITQDHCRSKYFL